MNAAIDQFSEVLTTSTTSPIIFVGSGLSRRYLRLEAWADLLGVMAKLAGEDFGYVCSSVGGDYPKAAEKIAALLHPIWWKSENFSESRKLAGTAANHSIEFPLKFEIARHLSETGVAQALESCSAELKREIDLLKKCKIDAVITTNRDTLMEHLFPDFRVYAGQSELFDNTPMCVAEIYKIHGCATKPAGLVATASDYSDFVTKNPYLASKILSMLIEHPVVFLGYSLGDFHINEIIRSIVSLMSRPQIERIINHFIMVEWNPDVDSEPTFVDSFWQLNGRDPIPAKILRAHWFDDVFCAMDQLEKPFPARILRALKDRIYRLVRDNDPKSDLAVIDMDDTKLEIAQAVIGVGVRDSIGKKGYRAIRVNDLIREVLTHSENFAPDDVLTDCIPTLLTTATLVPVHYFISRSSPEAKTAVQAVLKAKNHDEAKFIHSKQYEKKGFSYRDSGHSLATLTNEIGFKKALPYAPILINESNADEAAELLRTEMEGVFGGSDNGLVSLFRKAACVVDYIKYCPYVGWPPNPTRR